MLSSKEALSAAVAAGEISGAVHCMVLHDDECGAPEQECSCRPEYIIEPLTVETWQRGQAAQERWKRGQKRRGAC